MLSNICQKIDCDNLNTRCNYNYRTNVRANISVWCSTHSFHDTTANICHTLAIVHHQPCVDQYGTGTELMQHRLYQNDQNMY